MDAWDFYFATIVGWSLHPGYFKDGTHRMTLIECAAMTDEMVALREAALSVDEWTPEAMAKFKAERFM